MSSVKKYDVTVGNVVVAVCHKMMKNMRLRVVAPQGEVRLSVPRQVSKARVVDYLHSQLAWIRQSQAEIVARPGMAQEMVNGEEHFFAGQRYVLRVVRGSGAHRVEVAADNTLVLVARHGTTRVNRLKVLQQWYRQQLLERIPELLAVWPQQLGVKVEKVTVRRMRSRWGSCNVHRGRISLNLDLARYPWCCLEYVLAHELVHLLEPSHNQRFWQLLADFFPAWQTAKARLGQGPGGNGRKAQELWCVYMVLCDDNTLYTGITNNIEQRLIAHNSRRGGAKYTRARQPVRLVYVEDGLSHSQAAKREYAIKQLTVRQKRKLCGHWAVNLAGQA